jgi:hypothetical protein
MSLTHKKTSLVVGLLTLLAAWPARASNDNPLEGFDFQLFAPAEVRYNGQPDPKEGIFFNYDLLIWSIQRPKTALIGSEETRTAYSVQTLTNPPVTYTWTFTDYIGTTVVTTSGSATEPPWDVTYYYYTSYTQTSTLSTAALQAPFTPGNRYQFGWMGAEHGWCGEVFNLQSQVQTFVASDVDMTFHDAEHRLRAVSPDVDPPGVYFAYMMTVFSPTHTQSINYPHYAVPEYRTWAQYKNDEPINFQAKYPNGIPAGCDNLPLGYTLKELPITFAQVTVQNKTDVWGTELMYVRRFEPSERWGSFELMFGARYTEFNESFNVRTNNAWDVYGTPTEYASDLARGDGTLANSAWYTEATNHVIGPQLAGQWQKQWGRLRFSVQGRFCAGLNQQDIHQESVLGTLLTQYSTTTNSSTTTYTFTNNSISQTTSATDSSLWNVPYGYAGAHTTRDVHLVEFSPVVDLRIDLNYQITKAIYAKVGWTGLWMDHIARPSGMINYDIDGMGILEANNWQSVLINGFNIGIMVNR